MTTSGIAALLVTGALAGGALAQTAAEPVGLAYEAPAGCPDADAFFREMTARTTRVRSAKRADAARKLHVVISKRGDLFVGRLSIEEIATRSSTREVTDTTCDEVVGALGLVAALAMDPSASLTPLSAADAGAPAAAVSERDSPKKEPEHAPAPSVIVDGRPRARTTLIRYSAGAQLELAAIADAVFSARIFGDIEAGDSAETWTPSFRFALGRSMDVERQATIGRATLHFTQASLEVCPLRVTLGSPLAIRPCAGVSAGILDAQGAGEGIVNTARTNRPWVTASAYARAEWAPLRALAFELDGGGLAPMYRDSFYFKHAPTVPIYRAPPAAFVARLGVRVRFP